MARRTMVVLLGVFVTAACTELPAITEAPTDGGAPTDAGTPPTDSGATVDSSVEPPRGDAGPRPDAGPVVEAVGSVCNKPGKNFVPRVDFGVTCEGEWAMVLKALPTSSAFAYGSSCWDPNSSASTGCAVDAPGDQTDAAEARYPAYSRLAGTRVRIDFDVPNQVAKRSLEFDYATAAIPLASLVAAAAPIRGGSPSVPTGFTMTGPTTAGLNFGDEAFAQVRIGLVGTAMMNAPPTSWLGVGGRFGSSCSGSLASGVTVGNGYASLCSASPTYVGAAATVYVK